MLKQIVTITSVFLLLLGLFPVQSEVRDDSAAKTFLETKTKLDSAITNGDKQELIAAKNNFEGFIPNHEYSMLANYYIAYANYRLSSLFSDIPEDRKEQYLNASIKKLEKVTEMDPTFAEGWALLGNCYGMKATGMISGMRYGPKSENAIKKALALVPQNPRVTMINGISLMYKPAMFGGSIEKAIKTFKKARDYFGQWSSSSEPYPDWGEAENYAWLAQAYIEQERLALAKEAYQTALQIDPDYYWVKEVLLPELQQKME
ncbi:hypothetical protein NC796_15465 [Aliifodinibius sp. S!AR15-10]|uniref:tetratricopeptide repeat protein n=1 Tax=Aliifodinibius sp. S!AR15-10 TaxID=2950437 RepID=UPI00285858C5|nr:hypothetical protein [Aliifodinibius sp. S!AR15-10]MDR8392553.1 hypothetical protein [Aliifodinibius sp. S!AR15-10]